jgi:Fe2+ or Zn2+ uptake regulation protein
MPSLSLSTVYRILDSLEDQGLIRQVSTTNGAARYDANLHPHQHLVCRRCGTMTDLEDESLAKISLPEVRIHHFIAEELDIRIVGTCVQCSSRARQKNQTGDPRSPAFKEEKPWRS